MRFVRRFLGLLYRLLFRNAAFRLRMKALAWRRPRARPAERRSFLFWVPGGMPLMLDVEAPLALALKLRGHRVHAVMCDGTAKACVKREVTLNPRLDTWSRDCASCTRAYEEKLKMFGLEYSRIGDHLTPARLAQLRQTAHAVRWEDLSDFKLEGVDIGSNIRSSILRYLKGAAFSRDPELLREYAFSALVTLEAAKNAVSKLEPTNLFMSHGMYVDWGPALRLALAKGLRVTCWIASYLHARFYFRHPTDTRYLDFHNIDDARWTREKSPLTESQAGRLAAYQRKRYIDGQSFDVKEFKGYKGAAAGRLGPKLRFANGRPTWAIFAHINWDCVSDYAPMLFEDFNDWIIGTLHRLRDDASANWLLKVHPAEAWDNPASGVQALVHEHFPDLPDHVRVVGFDEDVNPLDFYRLVDGAVTVYGTAGLELASLGKPVILAGHAHYSRKGFTYDPASRSEYFDLLAAASRIGRLTPAQRDLALRYCYIYFIQRQIPFPPVRNRHAGRESSFWSFDVAARHKLLPKRDPYVDFIAERIIDGEEFILPDELVCP